MSDNDLKEFTAEELANSGYTAFQGFVYDLADFAVGHPGGSELITEWRGRDGSDALLDVHPGGKAFIKHTLGPKDYTVAVKGTFPYVKKKRAAAKKKRNPNRGTPTGDSWKLAAVVAAAATAVGAAVYAKESGAFQGVSISSTQPDWIPSNWPTREHIAHVLLGSILTAVLTWTGRWFYPTAGVSGTGVGGWAYGVVTPALIKAIEDACPGGDQVYVSGDGIDADSVIRKHSGDMGFHKRHPPDVVVFPTSAEQVQAVVKAAYAANVPVVPRGAGSGLEGGAIPYQGGVVLDLMRMKKFTFHEAEMQAQVEPGLKKSELNELLAKSGYLFGPDPASNPSVGGMASTRGSGLSTVMYGTTAENVVSLKVVTPEGKLVQTRRRVRKSATGYDLTQLFVGSEGTLGVIVELTLKVQRVPKVRCGAFIGFANLRDAATATIALVQASLSTLCRCELLNVDGVRATNKKYGTKLDERPTIFLEYRSTQPSIESCVSDAKLGEELVNKHGAKQYKFADKGEELDKLWEARRGCYIASITYRELKGDRVYLSDTCVPISNIARMISETEDDFTSAGFPCIICAHIADGNFHACIPYQPEQQTTVKEIETRMIKRALSLEGTVSGEHGVGVGKIEHVEWEHGADHINVQRAVKRAIDPRNIMNPGKIFILPRHPGGCCDLPEIYRQTENSESGGTYNH